MADLAALGLRVDGVENLDKATQSLNSFAEAESGAQKAATGLGTSTRQAKPAIDGLAAASAKAAADQAKLEAAAAKAGISVKQLQASLRGVPAQFTDIAISLQGGMNPLTVFLQQGGQLKDMFGGAVPAARALGGYILGLINPLTVAATAIAALGAAYYSGSKEADNFRKSLATTGNAAGLTVSQLQSMAASMGEVRGTTGQAAEALAVMVSAGVRADGQLQNYTETALRWSKATGEGVDVVAERFVALQKDPLTAALKLNETTNFLTASVYDQIKSLEEQGDKLGAAKVAMDYYSGAMSEGAASIEKNLGYIEQAWNAITSGAKKAWDAMLNVGRTASLDDQLTKVEKEIERLEAAQSQGWGETGGGAATGRVTAAASNRIKALREERVALLDKVDAERLSAAASQYNATQVAAKAAWDKIAVKSLSDEEKLNRDLAAARKAATDAGTSEAELKKVLAKIQEDYDKKQKKPNQGVGVSELAQIQARVHATQQLIKALQEQGAQAERITEGERLAYKIQQEIDSGKLTSSQRVQKQRELEAAQALQAAEEQVRAEEKRIEMVEKAKKAEADRQNTIMEMEQRLQSQRQKQDAELASYGMGNRAAKEMQERLKIQQDQDKQIADMRKQHGEELRKAETDAERAQLEGMFAERLSLTQQGFDQELALYDLYVEQKLTKDADYMAGWQASLETYLENSENLYALAGEQMTGFLGTAQSSISGAFMSMLDGTKSVGDAFQDMAVNMGRAVVNALTDMAAQWLVYQAVQLVVGKTTAAASGSILAATANANALMAGINAFASTAAIPIVGPTLAPAAMATALAVTMPMAATVSALSLAGMAHDGIDAVPETGTWLLEKGERVTTANTSARLDSTLARIDSRMSGNSSGGMGSPNVNLNVQLVGGAFEGAQVTQEYDEDQEAIILRVVSRDIAEGGPISRSGQRYMGWNRVGT